MKPYLRAYLDEDKDEERIFYDFVNFYKEIRNIFGRSDKKKVAIRKI